MPRGLYNLESDRVAVANIVRRLGRDAVIHVEIHETMPDGYPHALFGKVVYHRYDDGWYRGIVLRQIACSSAQSRNGKFAMKFSDSVNEIDHTLLPGDYGPAAHWVVVK